MQIRYSQNKEMASSRSSDMRPNRIGASPIPLPFGGDVYSRFGACSILALAMLSQIQRCSSGQQYNNEYQEALPDSRPTVSRSSPLSAETRIKAAPRAMKVRQWSCHAILRQRSRYRQRNCERVHVLLCQRRRVGPVAGILLCRTAVLQRQEPGPELWFFSCSRVPR